ncbi:hypothetical protein E2C01_022823 [Portunus trituberculatus]|uniref:Uncharacterized protein n=1 Tax=Portunus trituberculatus TaxID=210409 RepID=A0A5B7E6E9_PORTR|nr:hypothetical protein [Portunus trituberculatus]
MAETVCLLGRGTGSALSLQNHCLALMTVNVDSSGGVKERPDDHCVPARVRGSLESARIGSLR